jgi:hypothetical protein
METHKTAFFSDAFFSLVIRATLQRSLTYEQKATDKAKREFKDDLRKMLETLSEKYHKPVSEKEHICSIELLSNELSYKHAPCLANGRFRIGSAQKAFNLHLKYLWCLGLIPEPPHCPFDSIIIKRLPATVAVNWTELDDIEKYRKMVETAQELAGNMRLASWELIEYNEA